MNNDEVITSISDTPVWTRFGLSYASYAVFPRIALCSMPIEWQEKFVSLLDEMIDKLPDGTMDGDYLVKMRENGKFVKDPLSDYRHHPKLQLKG